MIPQRFIRTAARAIVICDGRLLAVKMKDKRGIYYILPGGGQKHGETLHETLLRECKEEVGVEVKIGELLYTREYIGKNHDFNPRHKHFHQLEHVFRCEIDDPHAICRGNEMDNLQVGVAWLDLAHLDAVALYPKTVKEYFTKEGLAVPATYLGDCN